MSAPISYKGLTSADHEVLLEKGLLKKSLTRVQANKLLQDILDLGNYESVHIETVKENGQEHWQIVAIPHRKIQDIQVTGHKAVSKNEIMEALGISIGDLLIQKNLSSGVDNIKAAYQNKGYFNTQIDFNVEDALDQGQVIVNIHINEGVLSKIESIDFITPHQRLKKLLLKRVKSYEKKPYVRDDVREMQSTLQDFLFERQYFRAMLLGPGVKFNEDRTQVSLIYEVENPYFFFIDFKIFDSGSKSTAYRGRYPRLRQVRKSLALSPSEGLRSYTTLSHRVRDFYKSKGYPKVEVSYVEQVLADRFEHRVFFHIRPGSLSRLKDIEVISMNNTSVQEYLDVLKSDQSYLTKVSGIYVKENIHQAVERLIASLQDKGYLRARMQSLTETFENQDRDVSVRIVIDEGPLTKVRHITFKGNQQVTRKELLDILKLQPGEPVNLSSLEKGFDAIREHYLQNGYLDVRIKNQDKVITYYNNDTLADIVFDLHEGPQVVVGQIVIQGNERTKTNVILKELEFKPGSILTLKLIQDSQYRLRQMRLFSRVEISLSQAGSSLPERTVLVRVTELDHGLFRFMLGANSEFDFTLRGLLGLSYRNLWGTARGINTYLELRYAPTRSFLEHSAGLSYYEPFIFGSRIRGRANLVKSKDIQRDSFDRDFIVEDETAIDGLLERELNREITLSYTVWKLERQRRYNYQSGTERENQIIGSTGVGIEFDYRNDLFNTTKGIYSQVNMDFADPVLGSTKAIRYVSLSGGFNFYIPLASRWILANSVNGGYITNLNRGRGEIPESKGFWLGGQSTIRGYRFNEIPGPDLRREDENALTILTNSYFYLLKSELRFPIFKALGGVFFYDGGEVRIAQRTKDDYKHTVGAGLRIATPVGPVSIEYGFKLARKSYDLDAGRLHFSIGAF